MPEQAKSPLNREPPKDRGKAPRKEQREGQVNPDKGAAGAPQGGQIHGRQGDQEGMKR